MHHLFWVLDSYDCLVVLTAGDFDRVEMPPEDNVDEKGVKPCDSVSR
jgi:hypothetical protein